MTHTKFIKALVNHASCFWNNNSNLLNYSCIIISIFFSFSYCFFGLDYTDSPFWYSSYIDNSPPNFLVFGTIIFVRWLTEITNDNITTYRIIHVIIQYVAILIPLISLTEKNTIRKYWGFIVLLSSFYFTSINFNILSPDSFTILFISVVYTITCIFYTTPKKIYIILNCFFIALASTTRISNLCLIIPVLLSVIPSKEKITYKILTITILTTTFYLILLKLGSPSLELTLGDDHRLITTTTKTFSEFLPIIGLSLLLTINNYLNFNIPTKIQICINTILCVYVLYHWRDPNGANFATSHFLLALVILPSLIISFFTENKTTTIILLSFGLVAAAGSDTGFLKITHGFIFFIPIIIKDNIIFFHTKKNINIFIITSIIVFVFGIKLILVETYGDQLMRKLIIEIPKVPNSSFVQTKNIVSYNNNDPFISNPISITDTLHGLTLHYGYPNWMLHYLNPDKIKSIQNFNQPKISKNELRIIQDYTKSTNCKFIMISKADIDFNHNYRILKKIYPIKIETQYFALFKTIN